LVFFTERQIKKKSTSLEKTKHIRSSEISTSVSENGAVLYNPDNIREKYLNQTAFHIWKFLNGKNSIMDISKGIKKNFDSVPEKSLKSDIENMIYDLKNTGFVREAIGGEFIGDEEYVNRNAAPDNFDVSLTGKCNLHCDYCFYANEMNIRPDLSTKEWFLFFDELGSLAVRNLTLSGGELFVRKDLWEIIDHIIDNRMRFTILSNGTLITEKTLESFNIGKRRKRLDSIQISIDGSCSEIHDRSRGAGSFDKAIRGLRLLKEGGFPVTSRVTINRYNVDDLENVTKLLLEDIGLDSFGTNDAIPMGSGCDNRSSIILLPDQKVKAMKIMHELEVKYKGRINSSAGPQAKWISYGEMEHAKATGEKSKRWQMGYLTACGCMFDKLSVHHDGIISPCNMLPGLEMGRINKNPIKSIWQNHKILTDLKERRSIPMSDIKECQGCEWTEFCNGSCPGLPYTTKGDFNLPNMHDCYRRFLNETGMVSPNVPWFKS